jgi:hypothetical protein
MNESKSYQQLYYLKNRDKVMARSKKWAEENKEQKQRNARSSHIKKSYGITLEQEQDLKNKQDNKCPICKTELGIGHKTHIDHCHTTGKVRGILCHACNVLLGHARESVDILKSAQKYLKKYS